MYDGQLIQLCRLTTRTKGRQSFSTILPICSFIPAKNGLRQMWGRCPNQYFNLFWVEVWLTVASEILSTMGHPPASHSLIIWLCPSGDSMSKARCSMALDYGQQKTVTDPCTMGTISNFFEFFSRTVSPKWF